MANSKNVVSLEGQSGGYCLRLVVGRVTLRSLSTMDVDEFGAKKAFLLLEGVGRLTIPGVKIANCKY